MPYHHKKYIKIKDVINDTFQLENVTIINVTM